MEPRTSGPVRHPRRTAPDHPCGETVEPSTGFAFDGAGLPHLLDERSRPDFRAVFGSLVGRSSTVDAAVARIRISGLDLRADEMGAVVRIRLVLAEVNGIALRNEAEGVLDRPERAADLLHLVGLLESGRIEVRSAPLAGWAPDFTVFHRKGVPWRSLVGPHWFARPYPHRGPALASVHGGEAAARLAGRFDELWRQAHEIGPALVGLLGRARERTRVGAGKSPVAQGKASPAGGRLPP